MDYFNYKGSDGHAQAQASMLAQTDGIKECHIVVKCTDVRLLFGMQLDSVDACLAEMLGHMSTRMKLVAKKYFVSDIANQASYIDCDEPRCAVSVVGQAPLDGSKVALWAYAMEDADVERCEHGLVKATHGRYTHMWHSQEARADASTHDGTAALFEGLERALGEQGCSVADNCMRTWICVRDIDKDYSDMVRARNEYFSTIGLRPDTHFIASTGIEGSNRVRLSAVKMDAYSVAGLVPWQVWYPKAPDHLNPTHEYGVAFERATAIDYGDRRHIFVSGTASIDAQGQVVYPGDVELQTERMLSNVEALLAAADADIDDIACAIVYLRDRADYEAVRDMLAEALDDVPMVIVQGKVCRPEWLIEMECMAGFPTYRIEFAAL